MGNTTYEKFRDSIPLKRDIHLPMVATSTTEVAVEIETGLAPGTNFGWEIVGLSYWFQNIASPHTIISPNVTDARLQIQLVRGEVPATPVMLSMGNNDIICQEAVDNIVHDATSRETIIYPRAIPAAAVTQRLALYLMFVTSVDVTAISLTTVEMFAHLHYFIVPAPAVKGEQD